MYVCLIFVQNPARLLSSRLFTLTWPYFCLYKIRSLILFSNGVTVPFGSFQSNPREFKEAMWSSVNFTGPSFPGLLRACLIFLQNRARPSSSHGLTLTCPCSFLNALKSSTLWEKDFRDLFAIHSKPRASKDAMRSLVKCLRAYLTFSQKSARLLSPLCLMSRCPCFSLYDFKSARRSENLIIVSFVERLHPFPILLLSFAGAGGSPSGWRGCCTLSLVIFTECMHWGGSFRPFNADAVSVRLLKCWFGLLAPIGSHRSPLSLNNLRDTKCNLGIVAISRLKDVLKPVPYLCRQAS
mmetsp:Transcript_9810/g.17820  ORF Transcript_9810/g.17820 Transcript_9810/m.17820 type:complete len:296 (-) Transcript_9810:115-1002(-)